MKRNDVLFALGVAVVVAVLYVLSITGEKPPDIPPNMAHAKAQSVEDCMGCHSEGKAAPLRPGHPPKEQCFECHEQKTGRHGVMH